MDPSVKASMGTSKMSLISGSQREGRVIGFSEGRVDEIRSEMRSWSWTRSGLAGTTRRSFLLILARGFH